MEKQILVSGYYGMNNTGDDCLLSVTAWGLRTFLNSNRIFVTTNKIPDFMKPEAVAPVYAHRQVIKGQYRISEWITAFQSKTVIFGGGSVFHSVSDMKRKMELLRLSGKGPHYAIGVSLGPFSSKEAEKYCLELLKHISFTGLRDQKSFDIAQAFSSDINFRKTFDLAPLLLRAHNMTYDQLISSSSKRSGIGIALCDYERFVGGNTSRENMRRAKLINTIKALPKSLIDEIVLIDFNGHGYFGDSRIHADIRNGIAPELKVRHIPYIDNPLVVLKEIGKLRLLISMRLHATIFGFIANTPTIVLSYHQKCRGWASQIKLSEEYVLDSAEFEVSQLRQLIMEILDGKFNEPQLRFPEAERLAMINFVMLGANNR